MPPTTTVPASTSGSPCGPGPDLDLDTLVAATPASRDRTVDAVRALAIVVVVLWHWVFSITHVDTGGALSMPNPVGDLRFAWAATWVLQVMPVFFVVGGFANLASREALERRGRGTWRAFARVRTARLGRPIGAFVALWAVGDAVARTTLGVPSVLEWGMVVFVPLWFLGAYTAVLLLTPLTVRAHRAAPAATLGALSPASPASTGCGSRPGTTAGAW